MQTEPDFARSETDRRLANLIRLGTVAEADYGAARVRVQSGDLLTGWLPWLTLRAGPDVTWWAPEVGEQVLLLSPSGDPAQGVVLAAIYQAAHPAPEYRETVQVTVYADGTRVCYDRETSHLTIEAVGNVTLIAAADVSVQGRTIRLN